jgi:hypothetical protein
MHFNNCQRIEKGCVQVSSFVVYVCSMMTVCAQADATACRQATAVVRAVVLQLGVSCVATPPLPLISVTKHLH